MNVNLWVIFCGGNVGSMLGHNLQHIVRPFCGVGILIYLIQFESLASLVPVNETDGFVAGRPTCPLCTQGKLDLNDRVVAPQSVFGILPLNAIAAD